MSSTTYTTLEGELTVRAASTVARSGATNAIALIGGYDKDNAASAVTAGEALQLSDPATAADTLGECELSRAAAAAADNGVETVWVVPVPETETTESFTASQTLSLAEDPIFDPTLHPEHDITVTDTATSTDLTVEVVYDDPVPTPSEDNTANVNPILGSVECDASSDYDVTYTYGDYVDPIDVAADLDVRYLCILTEAQSLKTDARDALDDIAADFDFKRAVVGATPNIASGSISSYTPAVEDWRLIEVAPSRGTRDGARFRPAAAVCGLLAAANLGPDGSILYDEVGGITNLNVEYRGSDARNFSQVTSITRTAEIGSAETTSAVEQYQNIYATEIIDAVALDLFDAARSYAGGPQDLGDLEASLASVCDSAASGSPPLLGFATDRSTPPYDVSVSLDPNDNSTAQASVSIVPHPIAETVTLDLTVADGFVTFDNSN